MQFDFYYGSEAEQFSFVRIPKVLFTDKEHFGMLSSDAKILYGLLLERMCLSRKNNWIDKENRVYIIFTIDEIAEQMGVCSEKAVNILKELDEENGIGLVKKKRRGLGLPSILYVKNFIVNGSEKSVDDVPLGDNSSEQNEKDDILDEMAETPDKTKQITEFGKTEFKSSEIPNSRNREIRIQEFGKTESNNINKNNTDMSYIDYQSINQSAGCQKFSPRAAPASDGLIDRTKTEEAVKEQIDYDCLISHPDSSVVQMIEAYYFYIAIGNDERLRKQC